MTSLLYEADDGDVGLYFVVPSGKEEDDCNSDMKKTFEKAVENELHPSWKKEESCLSMSPSKKNVFVFEKFGGSAFEHLRKFRCISVVGPRCLLSCLNRNEHIPIVSHPTFTASMRELIITSSGGGVEVKSKIKEKVELMGGTYMKNFTASTTHVVVSSVASTKYEKALELGIPVMIHDWVEAVWKESLKEDVMANDKIFDRYKCPPFYNLKVCTTGLTNKEIYRVKNLVEKHGGTYMSCLTQAVNILVVNKKSKKTDKFSYAQSWSIPCVSPSWIYDSVQNGHALPTKSYELNSSLVSSSPTSEKDVGATFLSSDISGIQFDQRSHIDETLLNSTTSSVASFCPPPKNVTTPLGMGPPKTPVKKEKTPVKNDIPTCSNPGDFKHHIIDLDLNQTKKAGSFLDGCRVFLTGWNSDEEEKLKRILKCSGAARFTELSDSVTHVLVGDLEKPFVRTLKNLPYKVHVVNIKWLIQSVTDKRPAAEEDYSCFPSHTSSSSEAPSPLSKKGMALLQRENFSPCKSSSLPQQPVEGQDSPPNTSQNLLAKYKSADSSINAMPPPPPPSFKTATIQKVNNTTNANDSDEMASQDEKLNIFNGLNFVIVGVSEEAADYVENDLIKQHGGDVVPKSFKGVPDYAVVPLSGAPLPQTVTEIITSLWLEHCIEEQALLPLSYFHEPVPLDANKKPLRGCVLGLSGYSGKERQFILELAKALGAIAQEVFAKRSKNDVVASTHLVCKTNEGSSKYNAAMKWGRPAISHKWLLACASSGTRVPEKNYLLDPNQVLQPVENVDISTCSTGSTTHNKFETPPHIAALKRLPCFKTPEQDSPGYDKAEVQRILNHKPSPNPYDVPTPPVPIGFSENPTPGESKRVQRWLNRLPGKLSPSPPRRDSTPLHVLRKKILEIHSVTTPEMLGLVKIQDSGLGLDTPESAVALQKAAVAIKVDPVGDSDSQHSTPKTANATASRKLFGNVEEDISSPIDGQLDKLKKLMETPDVGDEKSTLARTSSINQSIHLDPETQLISDSLKELKDGSQPYAIKWEDPININRATKEGYTSPLKQSNRNPGEEVVNSAKRKSSENPECEPEVKKCTKLEQPSPQQKKAELPPKYVFSLSHVGSKEPYASLVRKLGGVLLESSTYDPSSTHLVLDRAPQRSEKLLAFIASGKWVLHISYLEESAKAGKFLKEEDYEWGNPKNQYLLKVPKLKPVEEALAKAAHRWRTTLAKSEKSGAFEGFKCRIYASEAKMIAFSRLVSAGGGEVVPQNSLEAPSFCLVSSGIPNLAEYAKQGIPCIPITFLYEHLTIHPPPSLESKVLLEYKKLREEYSRS